MFIFKMISKCDGNVLCFQAAFMLPGSVGNAVVYDCPTRFSGSCPVLKELCDPLYL